MLAERTVRVFSASWVPVQVAHFSQLRSDHHDLVLARPTGGWLR